MQANLTSELLSTLNEADFKKLLKKDKPFLKKAQAVLFCQDYNFADNKKSLAMLLFRKPKEAKETFKALFKDKIQTKNKMAYGQLQCSKENGEIVMKVLLQEGGLSPEKITTKGKKLFGPILKAQPVFVESFETPNTSETSTTPEAEQFQNLLNQFLNS